MALSQERGLTLETTSGRVAASVRAVLSAYTAVGAESMVVDVDRRPRRARGTRGRGEECRLTLKTPEHEDDSVVIEIRGRCPDQDLPIVRLDYASPGAGDEIPSLSRPIEPRQLYDVLRGLLEQQS